MKEKLTSEERLRRQGEMLPPGFDPHQAMRVLAGYLRNLEGAFEDHKKASAAELRQMDGEYRALCKVRDDQRQELERLTGDLMDLTNGYEEQESLLSTANQKVQSYEKQFKKLHRDINEMANKLAQKENDANFYRQELARSVQEVESLHSVAQALNQRLEELERKLAVERETAVMHEKEARRLNLILSESQGKNALTERKLEETVVKYNAEIKRLSERSGVDAQHEVNLLKKRVRSSLAPELRELDKLMNARLNVEVASNLKALMVRLITKLEQAGLDLA